MASPKSLPFQSARMDEANPGATASPDQGIREREAAASNAVFARRPPPVAASPLTYFPHAAIAAWLLGIAWFGGSPLVGPAQTVVQQEGVPSAKKSLAAQKMAEESRARKSDDAQALTTTDVIDLGSTKPRLDVAKAESNGAIASPDKVEHLRAKSPDKFSKASERLDRIGLKIASLLAAAPVPDRAASTVVARRRAPNARHDAFDPSQDPAAPGAPRPLGTIAPAADAKKATIEYAYGQRTN